MGKKGKKDPNAPTLIAEDTVNRVKKLIELKVAIKQPKPGQPFTSEEFCIPPVFHGDREFKQIIHYWQNCAVVHYHERDMKVPSRVLHFDDDDKVAKKRFPRKELMDLQKWLKKFTKQATKQTGKFMKQMDKKEAKETKREGLIKQITEVDLLMNDELRASRKFVGRQELFEKKYMVGSKLGEHAPAKDALILVEQSDKMTTWVDEAKDEVTKLLNQVIDVECETFNLGVFNASGGTNWCPQFQSKVDPKKGLADSIKWLGKNVSAKTCNPQPFPPDWSTMVQKITSDPSKLPWRIFICCSRVPHPGDESDGAGFLNAIEKARQTLSPPMKNQPVLPINVVAFDYELEGDQAGLALLSRLAGPDGLSSIDTSAQDLLALDKMLKSVQTKKKQLDKLNKKLDKMEDLSEQVAEMRQLFQMQISLQRMLESDLEMLDFSLKREEPVTVPEI
jgi:hypothetical protein